MRPGVAAGAVATAVLLGLTGCATTGPAESNAGLPAAAVAAWQSPVPWQPAQPADHLDKGAWWTVFGDAQLDHLQAQALDASPTLAAVAARVRQAQAGTLLARSAWWPRVDASLRSTRQETSANRPAATYGGQAVSTVQNDNVLSLAASYEPDLFGRVSNDVASARASEQQARADLANARLVLSADLAASYFVLRQADAEIDVVRQSIELQTRAVQLLQARRDGGAASGLDVAQQQAQLDATRTQLELLLRQRPQLEHALATLTGQPATTFKLASQPAWAVEPPPLPLAMPSEILQRRPDVASAERAVAAANAQIGVARAAYFPSIVLGASGGWESRDIEALFNGPSLIWSLGASVAQNLFDGGRNDARLEQARAQHDATTAAYRLAVLRALQEVEDGLSGLSALSRAAQSALAASRSAQRALDIAQSRHAGGLATYLDVVTAQQNLLNSRRQSVQIGAQQLAATAYLAKALGGGWRGDEWLAEPVSLGARQPDHQELHP
jgi:NodT family efflux transporter outer membrane factor (OMF) lipoprotein